MKKQVTMAMNNNIESMEVLIIPALMIIIFFIILAFVLSLNEIRAEFRQINTEIRRNHGREQRYWKKRKRRMIISLIFPFIKY